MKCVHTRLIPHRNFLLCAAVHVDFLLPPGKLTYEVAEGEGSLEVCLVLANIGSYGLDQTLNTSVIVHLSTIQTDNTTHEVGQYFTIY